MNFKTIGAAMLAAMLALPAAAATYNFSYTTGAGVTLTADVDGTVTSNPNLIQVNGMSNLMIGGVAQTVLGTYKFYDTGAPGWLGLDGNDSSLVIRLPMGMFYDEIMFFVSANPSPEPGTYDRFFGSSFFAYAGEEVVAARYSLREASAAPTTAPIPLPAGGLLLISGLGLLALRRKRG